MFKLASATADSSFQVNGLVTIALFSSFKIIEGRIPCFICAPTYNTSCLIVGFTGLNMGIFFL